MNVIDLNEQKMLVDCHQCGYQYETHKRYMSPDRNQVWWLCWSCKAQPMQICRYGDDWCKPWQGDFDLDLMLCLDDNGRPVKVGARTCGHMDCVRADHLISQ